MDHAKIKEAMKLLETNQEQARHIMDHGVLGHSAKLGGLDFRRDLCAAVCRRMLATLNESSETSKVAESLGRYFMALALVGNPKSDEEALVAYLTLFVVPISAMATCLGTDGYRLAIVPIEKAADDV